MMSSTPEQINSIFNMSRDQVEREFSPYFYTYFKYYFDAPVMLEQYSRFCRHVFDIIEARDKNVLDVGCGFGLISIHIAAFGAGKVYAVDANEEKITVLQNLLSQFDPSIGNIEVKLDDALRLPYEDNHFSAVIANEVISHVRDTDAFLREVARVLKPGGILYLKDSNNTLDIVGRYRRRKIWLRREYGPVDMTTVRGTEKPLPWVMLRKEIIQKNNPQLDDKTLELLAKETAGMYGENIENAVEQYLKKGKVIGKPAFKYRDPVTGECSELPFNPFLLKNRLDRSAFKAQLIKPFFATRAASSVGNILINTIAWTIRSFYPLSIVISPQFEIRAVKK